MTGPGARIEIVPALHDRWGWRFVEPASEVVLDGNLNFETIEEAEASARRTYPDVTTVVRPESDKQKNEGLDGRLKDAGRVLGALALLALLFEGLRRLGER